MKRKASNLHEEESRLSKLLFNQAKNFTESLKQDDNEENVLNSTTHKPVWFDDDDKDFGANIIPGIKGTGLYTEKLKQKFEILVGTPNWAKLNKKPKSEDSEQEKSELQRKVGHLAKTKKKGHLKKDFLEIKRFPKINSETGNEGPIISCIEFHPKASVALVAGQAGIVSLFSIGGDVNSKLHSFKLKKWKVSDVHFTPDGAKVFIASKLNHSYCVYDLVKAEPKLIQLPKVVKRPKIFELSPDGKFLATTDGLDEVFIICASSKELLRSLKHNTNVESLTFSHNSQQIYCFGIQGEITIWDLATYRSIKKFYDEGCVTASCIETSHCGRLLATGSGEGIVNVYETANLTISTPVPLKSVSNLTTKITELRFNASTEILAASSGYYPNAVKLIHIPSYHVFSNFPQPSANLYQVDTVSFSPNSGFMSLGNNKSCAYLYRLKHYKNY